MQKNSRPETAEFSQQDYTRPERLKRKGPTTATTNTECHRINRREEDMMEMQVSAMYDIARTFNTCVCGVPPKPQKGTFVATTESN